MDDSSTPIIEKYNKGDRVEFDLLFLYEGNTKKYFLNNIFSIVYLFTIKKNSGIIDKLDLILYKFKIIYIL